MKEYFRVNVSKYDEDKSFDVLRPASLNKPKDNAVMFIMEKYIEEKAGCFLDVDQCLIYWPETVAVPDEISAKHAVVRCRDPHQEYCGFFRDNGIRNLPVKDEYEVVNDAYIAKTAVIGERCTIFPGVYIGGEVTIGDDVFIGAGVKITGEVKIGDRVVIRENSVIGADGLTTDRDEYGRTLTMPQFGDVVICDDVMIGANTVIHRGAIDTTTIGERSKIASEVSISHNVTIGTDSFVVGNTIMMGSSSLGDRVLVSGTCAIGNYVHIGSDSVLGMGSEANKSIPDNVIAYGSPAKAVRTRK